MNTKIKKLFAASAALRLFILSAGIQAAPLAFARAADLPAGLGSAAKSMKGADLNGLKAATKAVDVKAFAKATGLDKARIDAIAPEALKKLEAPLKEVEKQVERIGKALENLIPVPNLLVDTRGRKVGLRMLDARMLTPRGGCTLKVDGHYKIGGTPVARMALRGVKGGPSIDAEASHDMERFNIASRWDLGRVSLMGGYARERSDAPASSLRAEYRLNTFATLRGGLAGDGRRDAGLSLSLSKSSTLDYTFESGRTSNHKVSWVYRL